MDTIQPKTKELLTYYCSCQGNLVTIATRYVADAFCPKEPLYQLKTKKLQSKMYLTQTLTCRLIDSLTHKIGRLVYWRESKSNHSQETSNILMFGHIH